jgi:hypothetical protein
VYGVTAPCGDSTQYTVHKGMDGVLDAFGPTVESFFLLSGAVQVLAQRGDTCAWLDVQPGSFIHIPVVRNTPLAPPRVCRL